MAKQLGPILLQRTIDNITFYKSGDQYLVRTCNRLNSKRVKTSPRFRLTMVYAGLMKTSSTIASRVYKALPMGWRQYWMYKAFVGEAMSMLKSGITAPETEKILWSCYVTEFAEDYKEQDEFIHKTYIQKRNGVQKLKVQSFVAETYTRELLPDALRPMPHSLYTFPRAG